MTSDAVEARCEDLLRELLAHPDDLDRRRVYADYLEEFDLRGGAGRARYIRVGCDLLGDLLELRHSVGGAGLGTLVAQDGELRRLREALTEALPAWNFWNWFGAELTGAFPGMPACEVRGGRTAVCGHTDAGGEAERWRIELEGGFFKAVTCPSRAWMKCAGAVMSKHPVTSVALKDKEPMEWGMGGGGVGPLYMWLKQSRTDPSRNDRAVLPDELFDRLPGVVAGDGVYSAGNGWRGAVGDLSAACVSWGKDEAERERVWREGVEGGIWVDADERALGGGASGG